MLNGDGNENEIKERLPLVWKTWKFRGEFKWNSSSGRWKFRGKIGIPFEVSPFYRF